VCDKAFSVRNSQEVQECVRTGECSHCCAVCNKTFSDRGKLKVHQRMH